MVADSAVSDGDRVWTARKVWRIGDELVGIAGDYTECLQLIQWYRSAMPDPPPRLKSAHLLVLSKRGLVSMDHSMTPQEVRGGREAIGSGAKAAMSAYEALGWTDPKRAVQIVCKHDAASRPPVRVYYLKT